MPSNKWRRIALTLCGMVVVLLLAALLRYGLSRGVFVSVTPHTPDRCRIVEGISGIAAIAVEKSGTAYIASGDGLYLFSGGKLVRFSGTPKDFHPVALSPAGNGLHVLFRQDGIWKISLFKVKTAAIVSHWDAGVRPAGSAGPAPRVETVTVTRPMPPTVEEINRLSTDMLTDPADLVSVDDNRFYLVNRHSSRTRLGRWLDDAFLLPRTDLLYFDGMKFISVLGRLNTPSGIALSADLSRLYLAEEYPRHLAALARNDFTGTLDNPVLLSLPAAPRKIVPAPDGSLIVAARPNGSSAAVYRIRVRNGTLQEPELLYGAKDQSITAAAETGGHLLIGSENKLLDCRE